MNVLVSGGTGVIGRGLLPALLKSGHAVTLLSRQAHDDRAEWPETVRGIDADVAVRETLRGTLDGIDVVIHAAGVIDEKPPEVTYERVNVEGTRNLVEEAAAAGARRLVFISSLGADRGRSPYHQSKRRAEDAVRRFPRDWVIVRPGNVYGPGDQVISRLLKMVRALPVIPEVGAGDQRFQPVWFEDLGLALDRCVVRDDVAGKVVELAGNDVLTPHDVLAHLRDLTQRNVAAVPIPALVVRLALRLLSILRSLLGWVRLRSSVAPPINSSQLTMLLEGNVILAPSQPSLSDLIGRPPTPIAEGLRRLVDELPESPPSQGIGALVQKRFWTDLPDKPPEPVMALFKARIAEIMPIDFHAEPGAAQQIAPGRTFTAQLPVRGHIQIRVEACRPTELAFVTVDGHPLAGFVRFQAVPQGSGARFQIEVFARAGSVVDWMAEKTFAWLLQNQMWKGVARRLAEAAGETAPRIRMESRPLPPQEAEEVERMVEALIQHRRRREQVEILESSRREDHVERADRSRK